MPPNRILIVPKNYALSLLSMHHPIRYWEVLDRIICINVWVKHTPYHTLVNIFHAFCLFILLDRFSYNFSTFIKFRQVFKHIQFCVIMQVRSSFIRLIKLSRQFRKQLHITICDVSYCSHAGMIGHH